MIDVACRCGSTIRVSAAHAGKRVRCQQCHAVTSIPAPPVPPPVAVPEYRHSRRSETSRGFSLAFGGCAGALFFICLAILGVSALFSYLVYEIGSIEDRPGVKSFAGLLACSPGRIERSKYGTISVTFNVHNYSVQAISRAEFHVSIVSPDRAVPWADGDIDHRIPGGIEPGEQKTLDVPLSKYDGWHSIPNGRDDLEITVKATCIYGVDGKPLRASAKSQSSN